MTVPRGAAPDDPAPEDDALRWGDVDDPTYTEGREPDAAAVSGGVGDADGGHPQPGIRNDPASSDPPVLGGVLLVVYGFLAGLYVLSVVGWVAGLPLDSYSSPVLAFEILYQFGQFLAIVSPVLWFITVFLLTRGRRAVDRVAALAVGILIVAPWPLILGAAR